MPRWPFIDPPNVAVLSLRRIVIDRRSPVRYVLHDMEGDWQFLDGDDVAEQDAAIVGLGEMVEFDPTLVEVACLPMGFFAVRDDPEAPWQIGYHGDDEEGDAGE